MFSCIFCGLEKPALSSISGSSLSWEKSKLSSERLLSEFSLFSTRATSWILALMSLSEVWWPGREAFRSAPLFSAWESLACLFPSFVATWMQFYSIEFVLPSFGVSSNTSIFIFIAKFDSRELLIVLQDIWQVAESSRSGDSQSEHFDLLIQMGFLNCHQTRLFIWKPVNTDFVY